MRNKHYGNFDPFAGYGSDYVPNSSDEVNANYGALVRRNSWSNVVAKLFWAEDGGPIRTIIDGRKTRPTGTFHAIKGGARAMPWDSKLERTAMCMADLSSRVRYLLAQPHRLEISVRGTNSKPLIYFPDLLLQVHPSFVEDLRRGVPFSEAVTVPIKREVPPHRLQTLILEVKADDDPRNNDPAYQDKLALVEDVYSRRGYAFLTIKHSTHLRKKVTDLARRVDLHKFVAIDECDYQTCLTHFGGRDTVPRAGLERVLGDGPLARAKLLALHYRGFLSIDLMSGASKGSPVHLVAGEGTR